MHSQASAYPTTQDVTGQAEIQPGSTGQDFSKPPPSTSGFSDASVAGAYRCSPEPDSVDFDFPQSDTELSDDQLDSDEGEIYSDNLEKPKLTEDMTYRETVRSIRSFKGWNHIPPFESDLSESDKSNNPWKGKAPKCPASIFVAIPPDN